MNMGMEMFLFLAKNNCVRKITEIEAVVSEGKPEN